MRHLGLFEEIVCETGMPETLVREYLMGFRVNYYTFCRTHQKDTHDCNDCAAKDFCLIIEKCAQKLAQRISEEHDQQLGETMKKYEARGFEVSDAFRSRHSGFAPHFLSE